MNEDCFRDLNLTNDEIHKFSNAFSDDNFRQLFGQYVCEMNDPVSRKAFEKEVIELEREKGLDVLLVKPVAGYALKTSADGSRKIYINISSNANVDQLQLTPALLDNVRGQNVCIPHALCPQPQSVYDKRKNRATAFTVVFHPETLEKAASHPQLKQCVNETALEFVEKSFNVILDKVNFRICKETFKGIAQLMTVRKTNAATIELAKCERVERPNKDNEYVKPVYRIRYRKEVDLQDSTMDRYCKMNVLIPKEMIVEIELPLLKSIENTRLDVQVNSINLINENPNYKLCVNLPYEVNEADGKAKFDSVTRILQIELRITKKKQTSLQNVDTEPKSASNGVELIDGCETVEKSNVISNGVDEETTPNISNYPLLSTSSEESSDTGLGAPKSAKIHFLHSNVKYKLPSFSCNYCQCKLVFTIHVKNVNCGSFDYQLFEKCDGFWIKFCSLGTGHFPMFFTLCVVLQKDVENIVSLEYLIENDKVFVYAKLRNDFIPLEYHAGMDLYSLEKHYLNEPEAVSLEIADKKMEAYEADVSVSKFTEQEVVVDLVLRPDWETKMAPCGPNTTAAALGRVSATGAAAGRSVVTPAIACNGGPRRPVATVFDEFAKLDGLTRKIAAAVKRAPPPEKEDLEAAFAEAQTSDVSAFCDDFRDRFSLDEETRCLSESELLPSRSSAHRTASGRKIVGRQQQQLPVPAANQSWIVESKNAKKAKRQRKARDKKVAASIKSANRRGKCESEQQIDSSTRTAADDRLDSSNAEATMVDVESAYKFSHLTSRSILKKNRSFSESSGDELFQVECLRSHSVEDVTFSSDSYSRSVPKKTVRFNDVILKKLFSSDISILEQRKRTKRRLQRKERKNSDSDNSETESSANLAIKKENIRLYNENLFGENSESELTSLSESGGETSDDQSDNPDAGSKVRDVPCSKKNHKKRGKKSARKNASTAKHHQFHVD